MRLSFELALAVCAGPRHIIADEPTTELDASIQAGMIVPLNPLRRDQSSAFTPITHGMGVVAETADRVAVMSAGRVTELGRVCQTQSVRTHPSKTGLMDSISRLRRDDADLAQFDGAIPRLHEIPDGCAFHSRCPHAFDLCRRRRPVLQATGDAAAACFLIDQERSDD